MRHIYIRGIIGLIWLVAATVSAFVVHLWIFGNRIGGMPYKAASPTEPAPCSA